MKKKRKVCRALTDESRRDDQETGIGVARRTGVAVLFSVRRSGGGGGNGGGGPQTCYT